MDGLTQRKDGFVEMCYFGDLPWHKLGQSITIEQATRLHDPLIMAEVRKLAGMDWRINRSRVRFGEGDQSRIFDEHHVLFRSDTKDPLSVVSSKYMIVQPDEYLLSCADLVASGGFTLEAAGTLFGGKRFWATASIGETAMILGQDKVSGYVLLTGSCDGSLPTQGKFVATRAICNNTIQMALSEGGKQVRQSHRTMFDWSRMKAELGIASQTFGGWVESARRLALTTVSNKDAGVLIADLLVDSKTTTKADVTASSGYKTILSLFDHGKGNHGETLWDFVNGVTEYVDHVQRASSDSHRMNNAMFGRGDALKTMAFDRAIALAE